MTRQGREMTVDRSIGLPVAIGRAFSVFTGEMGRWWPLENTFANAVSGRPDTLAAIVIETFEGGRWFERATDGRETDWGRVVAYEPPNRLVLTWQITPKGQPEPDPSRASILEIRFLSEGISTTRVELTHRDFARHGPEGAAIRHEAMESAGGWTKFLERYATATLPATP